MMAGCPVSPKNYVRNKSETGLTFCLPAPFGDGIVLSLKFYTRDRSRTF
jgi:hypothetical protein